MKKLNKLIRGINKQGWLGWAKFSALTITILTMVIMIFLAFIFAIHSIAGNDWEKWYWGDDSDTWWYKIDPHMKDVNGNKPIGYADLDKTWLGLFIAGLTMAAGGIIFIGSWLSGARWMNKTNPRIKGQAYIRSDAQNAVFRSITLLFGILLMTSFALEVTDNVLDGKKNANSYFSGYISYFTGLKNDNGGNSGGMANWYFQCYLSSLFIGMALIFKKYSWMPVLLPMAFIGSVRTFVDPKGDWGEDGNWKSVYFHRFMYIHVAIVILPAFVMVANRQHYTFNKILASVLYTFMMVFVAYIIYALSGTQNNGIATVNVNGAPGLSSWGELSGIASLFGLEDSAGHTGGVYVAYHIHFFFWAIFVPFGLGLTVFIFLLVEAIYYIFNKDRRLAWRQNVAIFKKGKWAIRIMQFGSNKKAPKPLRYQFGFKPEGLDTEAKYTLVNGIAYKLNSKKHDDLDFRAK